LQSHCLGILCRLDGPLVPEEEIRQRCLANKEVIRRSYFAVNEMNLDRKRLDGVQGLPSGWKREEVVRRRGLSAGKIDVFYCR